MPLSDAEILAMRETIYRTSERVATLEANAKNLAETVKTMAEEIADTYVTLKEFGIVRMIVYGAVSAICLGFMTSMVGKVFIP